MLIAWVNRPGCFFCILVVVVCFLLKAHSCVQSLYQYTCRYLAHRHRNPSLYHYQGSRGWPSFFLSPTEQQFLSGTGQFTKAQQRYISCRIKRKLRLIDGQSRNAAAASQPLCNGPNNLPLMHGSDNLIHETKDFIELRGSPSLVGRGIANPMSERTRGFEILIKRTKFPLPAPVLL